MGAETETALFHLDDADPHAFRRAVLSEDGARVVPTVLAQGPWDPGFQFGGAAAAVMAYAVLRTPTLVPQRICRLTYDLLRPVPLAPLHVRSRIYREGKKIQIVEVTLTHDGTEVVKCTALRVRTASLGAYAAATGAPAGPPPAGDTGTLRDWWKFGEPPGQAYGVQIHFPFGQRDDGRLFNEPAWLRQSKPIIAGQDNDPMLTLAFAADFANGVGHPRDVNVRGPNTDITINIVREPVTDWLRIHGTGWTSPDGIGQSTVDYSDELGHVATVTATRILERA